MRVTIQDIAKEAGVSQSSVSLVLNGKKCRIPAETQKRIMDIAEEKGYQLPKTRVKKSKPSDKIIGVIYQDLDNFVHVQCMKGIEKQASLYGFNVVSCDGGNDMGKNLEYIEILKKIKVSGIILIPSDDMHTEDNNIIIGNALRNSGVHFLLLDQAIKNVFCDFVTSDNKAGASMAVEYLIEHGHKNIGVITGISGVYTTRKRMEGYKETLNLSGISFDEANVYVGNAQKDSGYFAAEYFCKLGINAIFAMNDAMALGVYQYAQEHNLQIGEDISVIGFDYSEECAEVTPSLTSVRQEGLMMGKKACEMIVGRILNQDTGPYRSYYFVPKLIEKKSVK